AAAELTGRDAGHEVDESPLLELPKAVGRLQTPVFDAEGRQFRGFMRRPTHPELPKRPDFDRLCRKLRLEGQFTPTLPGGEDLATCRGRTGRNFTRKTNDQTAPKYLKRLLNPARGRAGKKVQ